ncbi:MAG: AmmeMemoRadiSam system protein B [Ignavibacteria bacterium]
MVERLNTRPPKCSGYWYPASKSQNKFPDRQISSAAISPHAGFRISGQVSLEAVSYVKKHRIWILGTSHYQVIDKGISIFQGNYSSSIGKAKFPHIKDKEQYKIISKYFSNKGHQTQEHSIENVLYCINHFREEIKAFCVLVHIENKDDFDFISDDLCKLWNKEDSLIISTDWNHYVSSNVIGKLMYDVSELIKRGEIEDLYRLCKKRKYEACGIDCLYLASKILSKVDENTEFKILKLTDSSRAEDRKKRNIFPKLCVGYIAARN